MAGSAALGRARVGRRSTRTRSVVALMRSRDAAASTVQPAPASERRGRALRVDAGRARRPGRRVCPGEVATRGEGDGAARRRRTARGDVVAAWEQVPSSAAAAAWLHRGHRECRGGAAWHAAAQEEQVLWRRL